MCISSSLTPKGLSAISLTPTLPAASMQRMQCTLFLYGFYKSKLYINIYTYAYKDMRIRIPTVTSTVSFKNIVYLSNRCKDCALYT